MKRKTIAGSLIAAGVITLAATGYSTAGSALSPAADKAAAVAVDSQAAGNGRGSGTTQAAPLLMVLPDFGSIAEKYGPAVVNVAVTQGVRNAAAQDGPGPDLGEIPPEFFKRFPGPVPRGGMPAHGMGSGFIISNDGVILTNAHVVDGASEVTVKLTDKREFKAKVIGADRQSDIAVLKIDARDLPTVKLGNPADSRVGDWVLAIGSPFGFENSATSGIVSAKARTLPDGGAYVPFIQTDVAVNPGNSGGPLFNLKGEVIGINSQIYSQTGGYQGLSFAIPIDVAINVKDQLQQHGKVTRGRMGVTIQTVNQALADSFGLKKPAGALVSSVEKGSPAEKAGLLPGDVILKLNGRELGDSNELASKIANIKPGSTARLEVFRKGASQEIEVSVGELKASRVAAAADSTSEDPGRLGLVLRPLNPEERSGSGIKGGLLVEQATGPAAKAGIQTGDVILSFNGTAVSDVEQLREIVAKSGKKAALLVQRDEARIFIPVDLG